MFFYNKNVYDNYSLYKKEKGCEDCEYRCGKGMLSIEIYLQNTNQSIAQIEFYLWSVAYDNSKIIPVEEGWRGGVYLSEIYKVYVVNDIFYYKNVKEAIINKLKLWVEDFSFNDYFEKQENKIRYYIEESRQCDKWEEESFYINEHEYYDEYTDNIDSKDDYDLDYDEYDAGYKDE